MIREVEKKNAARTSDLHNFSRESWREMLNRCWIQTAIKLVLKRITTKFILYRKALVYMNNNLSGDATKTSTTSIFNVEL